MWNITICFGFHIQLYFSFYYGFHTCLQLKESEQKVMTMNKERDQLSKQRDSAIQEAHLWRSELAKARERVVILEAAVMRAEEKVRVAEADAETRIKEAIQKESTAVNEKQELLAYVNRLQAQLQRFSISVLVPPNRDDCAYTLL